MSQKSPQKSPTYTQRALHVCKRAPASTTEPYIFTKVQLRADVGRCCACTNWHNELNISAKGPYASARSPIFPQTKKFHTHAGRCDACETILYATHLCQRAPYSRKRSLHSSQKILYIFTKIMSRADVGRCCACKWHGEPNISAKEPYISAK